MLHCCDGGWLVAGGVGLFLTGVLTAALALVFWRRLVSAVAAEVARLAQPPAPTPSPVLSKHDKAHHVAVALSERATGIILNAIEDGQVQYARLQNALLLAEWVHAGHNPDAPWSEIVKLNAVAPTSCARSSRRCRWRRRLRGNCPRAWARLRG